MPKDYWDSMHMGCICVSITMWTDRKVTWTHSAWVMQPSGERNRIIGDTKLELFWFDLIRILQPSCKRNAYTLKEKQIYRKRPSCWSVRQSGQSIHTQQDEEVRWNTYSKSIRAGLLNTADSPLVHNVMKRYDGTLTVKAYMLVC